jgi:hypothetical protein
VAQIRGHPKDAIWMISTSASRLFAHELVTLNCFGSPAQRRLWLLID